MAEGAIGRSGQVPLARMLRLLSGVLCVVLLAGRPCNAQSVDAADAAVLLAAKAVWGGDDALPSWDAGAPCNQWERVGCDGDGRVVRLNLGYSRIEGSIPPIIGDLSALQTLDMSFTQLSGPIPSSIGNLTRLQHLDVRACQLLRPLPSSICRLAQVTYIDLSTNQLSGPLPSCIGNMAALQTLWLGQNFLNGSLPASLFSLTGLQNLGLAPNQLMGSIPSSIGLMTGLGFLDLRSNQLAGPLPPTIGFLTGLQSLDLSHNQLEGPLPSSIGDLVGLQGFWVGYNRLNGSLPSTLGQLTNLQKLSCAVNELSGSVPASIGRLTALQILELNSNQLTGPLPFLPPQGEQGQWRFADNFLFGRCPQLPDSWTSDDSSPASAFLGNCFQDCAVGDLFTVRQRRQRDCANACGSDQETGPCQGQGACFVQGAKAMCVCNPGFVSPASNAGTCVPASPLSRSPPSLPRPAASPPRASPPFPPAVLRSPPRASPPPPLRPVTPPPASPHPPRPATPPSPPAYIAKLCAGMVSDSSKCKCPDWARCQRKAFCNYNYVCRCVGVKRTPVTDPKSGLLKACI